MSTRQPKKLGVILVVVLATMLPVSAFGGSTVIGSVAGDGSATLGGVAILANTTLYSGDTLQVQDGMAFVSTDRSGSLTFGQDTQVSFLRSSDQVTVVLAMGSVRMQHLAESGPLSIAAGDLVIVPSQGVLTEARFARQGHTLVVTTTEGVCRVIARGRTVEVGQGKTAALRISAAPTAAGAADVMVIESSAIPADGAGSVAAFLDYRGANLASAANAANLSASDQHELAEAVARMYDDANWDDGDKGCHHKASEYEPTKEHCKCKDHGDHDHDHDGHCKHHHDHF